MEGMMAGEEGLDLIETQKLSHNRQTQEDLGEGILVSRARRRLRVIFCEIQLAGLGNQKTVQSGDRCDRSKAGFDGNQSLFPVRKAELGPKMGILDGPLINSMKCPEQYTDPSLKVSVLGRRHKARAEDRT
jgi:hypothetical protein